VANKPPVWLIGLDGASFEVLAPLIEAGRLPVLEGLIKQGASGVLKSSVVPFTPQAWASVITGANPGKHGVFGFVRQQPGRPPEFSSSKTIEGDKLWTWFGRRGLTNLIVNVPLTYPPEPLRGSMITGMMTPSTDSGFTYPAELKSRILSDWPDYSLDIRASIDKSRDDRVLDELDAALSVQMDVLETLVKEQSPDFFFPVFVMLDRIQHIYGHWVHPRSTVYDSGAARKRRPRIWESYARLDQALGRLLSLAPPGTNTILASDHGFTVERGGFYTNDFLRSLGLLTLKKSSSHGAARLMIKRFNLSAVKRFIPNRLVRKTISFTKEAIDWSRTSAYASPVSQSGIAINLCGRDPRGIVPAADYERVRDTVIEALSTIKDPSTGESAVTARRREELFSGPNLSLLPDIVLNFDRSCLEAKETVLTGDGIVWSNGGSRAIHHRDGLFIAAGPAVAAGNFNDLALEDIAPNILALAGLDIPPGLDGRARADIFDVNIKTAASMEVK
jgi:predicted AlkP superfamily phosphohydrolase/phosphomutase